MVATPSGNCPQRQPLAWLRRAVGLAYHFLDLVQGAGLVEGPNRHPPLFVAGPNNILSALKDLHDHLDRLPPRAHLDAEGIGAQMSLHARAMRDALQSPRTLWGVEPSLLLLGDDEGANCGDEDFIKLAQIPAHVANAIQQSAERFEALAARLAAAASSIAAPGGTPDLCLEEPPPGDSRRQDCPPPAPPPGDESLWINPPRHHYTHVDGEWRAFDPARARLVTEWDTDPAAPEAEHCTEAEQLFLLLDGRFVLCRERFDATRQEHLKCERTISQEEARNWIQQNGLTPRESLWPALGLGTLPDAIDGLESTTGSTPNGPASRFRFFWKGNSVSFADAIPRYRLCAELWDKKKGTPVEERDEMELLRAVWGEKEAAVKKDIKDLQKPINALFREKSWNIEIQRRGGKVWLEVLP